MKKCVACGFNFPSQSSNCPGCGWAPERLGTFQAYAPALALAGGGFNTADFADLADLEAQHFWFRARNRLIIWALGKYCPEFRSFLEIGCGTGFVLSGIASAYPRAQLHGSEIFTAGLNFAFARQPAIDFMQMDAREIPFINEFDAIGAFDVLEHIEEDAQVLSQIHDALKLHGIMLLTVPQHAWLWSSVDERACHVRRYTAKELHSKVKAAGFDILRTTSFVTGLLPAMLVSRLRKKRCDAREANGHAELRIADWLNTLFEAVLSIDAALIRHNFNLPIGGSRLIVARKL
ncbi:class I SAM-dependent methyltransferase [Trinickia acidisoli]|uniref:class I SAM-dependent methyltransferase n=1 Tax=Trinickia acidisoli TaxID=2767482 RepID=UPI001A8C7054|nr:class I SAM-dependent methyltransferase [Trinickia acidisoli]